MKAHHPCLWINLIILEDSDVASSRRANNASRWLVTVAFLKARLDEGSDHLGIFMPLVLDVLGRLSTASFTTEEIQEALAKDHGVAIPQQTVGTLLRRGSCKRLFITRYGALSNQARRTLFLLSMWRR